MACIPLCLYPLLKIGITHIQELGFRPTHGDGINWVLDSHRHSSLYLFQVFYKIQNTCIKKQKTYP
jgi:hypothetical protein